MFASRPSTSIEHPGRIRVAHPAIHLGSSTSRRHGLNLIEFVLVLGTISCVLLGTQVWNEFQPRLLEGKLTQEGSARVDLPPICDVAIAPNQREAVSVGMDGQLHIHDLQTRSFSAELPNACRASRSVSYSSDGNLLLVSSRGGHIELWSLTGNQPTSKSLLAHDGDVSCCQFAPDGTRFFTCGDDHRCIMWDVNTLRPAFELRGARETVRRARFLADGTRLITGDIAGHLQLWDLTTQRLVKQIDVSAPALPFKSFVEGLELLPGETEFMIALRGGGISVWNLESGELSRTFQHDGREFTTLSVSSDGSRAVTGGSDGQIDVWDVATGACLQSFAGHAGPVQAVTMTSDRRLAVSAGWDGDLKFWDI